MRVYWGNFTCWADIEREFSVRCPENGKTIVYACYEYEDCLGWATVLWWQDGKFWLVEGSHCSCYGLEGQFRVEETPLEAVLRLHDAGKFHYVEHNFPQVLSNIKMTTGGLPN